MSCGSFKVGLVGLVHFRKNIPSPKISGRKKANKVKPYGQWGPGQWRPGTWKAQGGITGNGWSVSKLLSGIRFWCENNQKFLME